jgi:hypothetical protein
MVEYFLTRGQPSVSFEKNIEKKISLCLSHLKIPQNHLKNL